MPLLAPMRWQSVVWLAQIRCVASGVCTSAARSVQRTITRTFRQRCVRDSGGCQCHESSERGVPLGQKQSAALVSPKPNPTSQPGRNAAAVNGRPQPREERLDSPRRRLRPRHTTNIVPSMRRLSYRQLPTFPGCRWRAARSHGQQRATARPSSAAAAGGACRLPLSNAPSHARACKHSTSNCAGRIATRLRPTCRQTWLVVTVGLAFVPARFDRQRVGKFTAPLPSTVERRAFADSCGHATSYRHPSDIRAVSARQSARRPRVVHRATSPTATERLPHRPEEG